MKKLMSIAILLCGLMLGGLGAEEIFVHYNGMYGRVTSGEEDKTNYYLTKLRIRSPGELGRDYIELKLSRQIKDSEYRELFVCSGDTQALLIRMTDGKGALFDIESGLQEESLEEEDYEQIKRKLNRYFRNAKIDNSANVAGNDYRIKFEEIYPSCYGCYPYDFVAAFNLFEKMKLSFPKKYDINNYKVRRNLGDFVLKRLNAVANGQSFDNGEFAKQNIKQNLDDNALEDLYYEFRDFVRAKREEFLTLRRNHTKKLLENTCAPVEKISLNLIKDGNGHLNSNGHLITFDKTRVKFIEDLNPTIQLFQFIPEQERKFIEWDN